MEESKYNVTSIVTIDNPEKFVAHCKRNLIGKFNQRCFGIKTDEIKVNNLITNTFKYKCTLVCENEDMSCHAYFIYDVYTKEFQKQITIKDFREDK